MSYPAVTRKDGGCFDGYRIINWDRDLGLDDEDIVPTLLTFTRYEMPNVQALAIAHTGDPVKNEWSCGSNPGRLTRVSVILHDSARYLSNMARLGNEKSRAKEAASIGLKNSYDADLNNVKKNVQQEGWNLVGSALAGEEDISHLFQQPGSLRCMLTFEGSDSFSDWVTDAAVRRAEFCGLEMKVHVGFRNEVRRLVKSESWQREIRPKLGKCSSVDAVGHSLGGATATLFTTCVDFANGSDDYNLMGWTMGTPALLPSL